jgi:hypothetical protein
MAPDRRLAITAQILEPTQDRMHAHVMAWLPSSDAPDGKDKLDACVWAPARASKRQLTKQRSYGFV